VIKDTGLRGDPVQEGARRRTHTFACCSTEALEDPALVRVVEGRMVARGEDVIIPRHLG
jgi:hypothetical protein